MNAIVRPLGKRTRFKDQLSSDGFAAYSLTVTVSSHCFRRGSARREKLRRDASNSLPLIVVSFISAKLYRATGRRRSTFSSCNAKILEFRAVGTLQIIWRTLVD